MLGERSIWGQEMMRLEKNREKKKRTGENRKKY